MTNAAKQGKANRLKLTLKGYTEMDSSLAMSGVCLHEYDLPLNEVDEGTMRNHIGVACGLTEDWRRLSIVYGSGHRVLH